MREFGATLLAVWHHRRDFQRNTSRQLNVEVLNRVRPAFFIMENVPQFLSSREFVELQGAAQPGGGLSAWRLESHILDAGRYGAAQTRKRALVVARPAGMRPLGPPPASGRRFCSRTHWRTLIRMSGRSIFPSPMCPFLVGECQVPSRRQNFISLSEPPRCRCNDTGQSRRAADAETSPKISNSLHGEATIGAPAT